jgi:hypothetical protein
MANTPRGWYIFTGNSTGITRYIGWEKYCGSYHGNCRTGSVTAVRE